jgi:hypothetical protein
VFRFESEFDEAQLYTTDVWLREEDTGDDVTSGAPEERNGGSGSATELTTRPLSPPPRDSVSTRSAAPDTEVQTIPQPLSPPPRKTVSAWSAAPEWGEQAELNWGANTSSTSAGNLAIGNQRVTPPERPSTARPTPRGIYVCHLRNLGP